MTKYRGYSIAKTSTTVGKELHGRRGDPRLSNGDRWLLKITDANGNAIRNQHGNLPVLTTVEQAKRRIDAEISRA